MLDRSLFLQRAYALAATAALASILPTNIFDLFTAAILLAHFLTAFRFHPWKKIAAAGALKVHLLLIAILMLAGQGMFMAGIPGIVLYFSFHFVLTELYESGREEPLGLLLSRGAYYFFAYAFFMKFNMGIEAYGPALLGASLIALAALLYQVKGIERCAHELLFLIPLAVAWNQPMKFSHILAYHVIVWWALPFARGPVAVAKRYLLESGIYTAIFLVVIFASYYQHEELIWLWRRETARFGYFHISISFLMSSLNPVFVRSAFHGFQGRLRNVI